MSILDSIKPYARFATGLRRYLRHKLTLEEARAVVQRRLAEREANFLRLVEKGIFGHPRSPYLPLLKLAQVELGDIRNMVRDKGLEGTLHALHDAGVHITFEEFKGRQPIVRQGQTIPVSARDFDNPHLRHYYQAQSGATTGAGTRVTKDLDHVGDQVPLIMLGFDAHGILHAPWAVWFEILPGQAGIANMLFGARMGNVPRKWFSSHTGRDSGSSTRRIAATQLIVVLARLFGSPIPWPERVTLDQAPAVARWAAEMVKAHGACMLNTSVSRNLRVCLAALEEGLDLTGLTCWGASEPPTLGKVRDITGAGARWVPDYAFVEAGFVGVGCARPADSNDIHFAKDALALIQRPRQVADTGITVDAFCFTALLPSAPKILLNVESDDYGVIEQRTCGCPLESCGFTEHLRHIYSFGKLTGEGVTLVAGDMIRILEQVLPARFGGSPLDYQLLEEEDEQGFTRLNLLIHPRIEISDEAEVIDTVLDALRQGDGAAHMAQALWSQAKALRIQRKEPIWTAQGKLMPLHLGKRSDRSRGGSSGSPSAPRP